MVNRQKFLDSALNHLTIADHMAYHTYPLVKDNKLLLKIFLSTHKSIICSINSMSKDHIFKKKIDSRELKKIITGLNYELHVFDSDLGHRSVHLR